MKFWPPLGPMLMNMKHIRKIKVKVQKHPSVWPRESNSLNLKEIHALGIEIIATQRDGRKNFDFMSSADIVKQS